MEPMIAFIAGTLPARLSGWLGFEPLDSWVSALRVGLAVLFLFTSVAHFVGRRRAGMIAMVPPRLPRPGLLVTVTGALEILGAVGLLLPATYRAAAICLALLLLALYPANVSAARRKLWLGSRQVTPIGIRTVMQVVWLAACVYVALQ